MCICLLLVLLLLGEGGEDFFVCGQWAVGRVAAQRERERVEGRRVRRGERKKNCGEEVVPRLGLDGQQRAKGKEKKKDD